MPDIPLRLNIIVFFCLLGLLPQVIISYISVDAYSSSLEKTYNSKVSQLVDQVAEQAAVKAQQLIDDLVNQTTQPYLQLSFQQYLQETRLELLKERLELFRSSRNVFSRIHLCYLNGERMISSNGNETDLSYGAFEKQVISGNREQLESPYQKLYVEGNELVFFLPVNSFRQSTRVIGILVAYLPVEPFTQYFGKINFGENTTKAIHTNEGEQIALINSGGNTELVPPIRSYSSSVVPLDWEITVKISEQELFQDVIFLKKKNTLFIAASILLAFAAWFIFSHRFTRPFKKIMEGTQIFATGNLDHHINVETGYEAKRLAKAFNDMASQLKNRQEELNQSARLASLGVMTAGLAHEIKNPLAGIKTSAQVIRKILDNDKTTIKEKNVNHLSGDDCRLIAELAEGVSDETNRLTNLLNDMLKFGRPRKPMPKCFDLACTVSHAIGLVQPEHKKREVSIINRVDSQVVFADSDQILQVILNLLNNSLQSVNDHSGQVELLSTLTKDNGVIVKIRDNGKGIPSDKLQRIFDPFFSLRESGTGLGLSVVYTLLKQNNANLEVTSIMGEGSEFILKIPVSQEERE
jgi:two-component system, NtrC family, sensor kinase